LGGLAWRYLPGGAHASVLLARARPVKTAEKYSRWVLLWKDFCDLGDGRGRSYPEFTFSVNKWYLFQGYLKQFTEDGDLNRVRSAINRHFDDEVQERPIMGVAVRRSIVEWKMEMDEMKKARGEEPGLNRVPCPEAAVRMLIEEGERADGADLGWFALQLVMLLCWLRADSVAGFQPGDCVVNADGSLTVCVRHMKMRPEFKTNPGVIEIAAPGPDGLHWRRRAVHVLRRANQRYPGWLTLLSERVPPREKAGSAAASFLTAVLRRLCGSLVLPAGCVISSHSWREMAAVSSYKADHNTFRMTSRGFWKRPETMWQSYIEPFLWFPFSALLAELYDDLH